jgi:hypothetical protein
MHAPAIKWKLPWEAIDATAGTSGVQRQFEREITHRHALYGRGGTVIGRRVDMDDVVVILDDGSYVRVHLLWHGRPDDRFPTWSPYGSQEGFIAAMERDAMEYGEDEP